MIVDDDIEHEAAQWFAAQRRGLMALEERQAFDAWRADPVHQAALNRMHEVWGEVSAVGEMGVAPRRRAGRSRRAAVAAVLVLGLTASLGGGAWWALNRSVVQTRVGEQRSQELEDGSIVALNVMTRARYDINARERTVYLNAGEAAFVVRKDAERPFLVRAGGYEVRAVGTAFNVRSRDRNLDVAVKEGVVEVRRLSGEGKPVLLRAGQRLQIKDAGAWRAPLTISEIPTNAVDEWRQRVLTYEDAPISQVIQDVNRFYERPLVIDPAFGRRHVTLRLVIDDREDTVKRLAALLGAQVQRADRADRLKSAV
ncbi:FecR domain-containing protein [Brevundimonas sp. 3P9-tot-E]|jgi:transmembrane sensor|uniref:FecR family protein n=1 Tax=Brevundimonas TaxID=41275 RepID=UPI001903E125|nr:MULTISPECIES: FecR domain-containing protein [Brevundimonas]MBK1976923.1 FecR domain-containing protein [Brevundimonas diminuta]MDA0742858.1 FecR domain-containing protein [Pseudomonadota bacterium]MDM8352802.1 FecR domain-containing protein [Brevundimonas diminuta]